jgi:hypothetical protein
VLPPLLWTLFACGVSFFIRIRKGPGLAALGCFFILVFLALAPTVCWAFFVQKALFGWAGLAICLIPPIVNIAVKEHV